MEKKRITDATSTYRIRSLIIKAKNGDKKSMEQLIQILEPDIEKLSAYFGKLKDDAKQSIITEFIQHIKELSSK